MELTALDSEKPTINFSEADATLHLLDHLECARKLACSQDLPVVQYLVQMAILALSSRDEPRQ
jgi:hypothetical protein